MPNSDDNFDTEIDESPMEVPLNADSASASRLQTTIDHGLAERLLQAFPEKFKRPDSPVATGEPSADPCARPPSANRLPRTVLQSPLSVPISDRSGGHDLFDAPGDSIEIPLAQLGQTVRRLRTFTASMPSSVRTLVSALVLAAAVGMGWWINATSVPVNQTPSSSRALKNTPVSSIRRAPTSGNHTVQNKKSTPPSAASHHAITPLSSTAETEAARALIKGQRIEALNLYQRLSKQFPKSRVYAVAVEALQRALQEACSNGVTMKGEPCSEN